MRDESAGLLVLEKLVVGARNGGLLILGNGLRSLLSFLDPIKLDAENHQICMFRNSLIRD